MNLVILDGSTGDASASHTLLRLAEGMGAQCTRFALDEMRLAPCLGDFECWLKTPGLCRTRDPAQDIARAMHGADLIVFLTPVVFGGYGAELKKAVDRLIGLVSPYFHDRDGLTRHLPRYERYAPILFIGLAERNDDEAAAIFRQLAAGNAINLLAPSFRTLLVSPAAPDWQGEIEHALRAALDGEPGEVALLPTADLLTKACAADPAAWAAARPPRSAAVFIGSARPKGQSTSESLARELIAGLEEAGVPTTLVYASQFIKAGRRADEGLEAMLGAELLVVAAPLYVDGLPYLVTRALEQLAERLVMAAPALRQVAGILNCGYPEAVHNHLALRLLRTFTLQSGLVWAGGLALGAGEIIHGRPLTFIPFLLRRPRRALQLAARALAAGQPIPPAASELMAQSLVPPRLFRWVARLRWLWQARAHGIGRQRLHARPHEAAVAEG